MSVGADLGRSSNVIPTSKRPPVRICGGLSDIQRMFWMSECDIWVWVFLSRTSVGLPCVMWEEAGLESEFWKRPQAHWVIDDETAGNLSFVSFSSPVYFRTYISYNWHIFKNLATFFFLQSGMAGPWKRGPEHLFTVAHWLIRRCLWRVICKLSMIIYKFARWLCLAVGSQMPHRLIFYSMKKIKTFTYETICKTHPPTLVQKRGGRC